jgi:hypothetical protein
MLAERILDAGGRGLYRSTLLPFRLTRRESSDVLLTVSVARTRGVASGAHHVHSLTLHYTTKATCIRHHLLSGWRSAVSEIVSHHFAFLSCWTRIGSCRTSDTWWTIVLTVNGRLRSNSILGRGRARFLRVCASLLHQQLSTKAVLLLMTNGHSSAYQIIVRLCKTEGIRRRSIAWANQVFIETLCVRTGGSLLSCARSHTVTTRLRA